MHTVCRFRLSISRNISEEDSSKLYIYGKRKRPMYNDINNKSQPEF